MSVNNFDAIIQELIKHQQIMQQLEEENREIRRQISDLREARGIFVDIEGKRFALRSDTDVAFNTNVSATDIAFNASDPTSVATADVPTALATYQNFPSAIEHSTPLDIVDAPTTAISFDMEEAPTRAIPESFLTATRQDEKETDVFTP